MSDHDPHFQGADHYGRPDFFAPDNANAGEEDVLAAPPKGVAIVESLRFVRECLARGVENAFVLPVQAFDTPRALEECQESASFLLVLLSWINSPEVTESMLGELSRLRRALPDACIVVLAGRPDSETARLAMSHGAQGYISMGLRLELAMKAIRFVLAGGTYVPPEILLAFASQSPEPTAAPVTSREMLVVRKIQEGKANKTIAFELAMCESTVKIHVRQIMKKLGAKNRTELAVKAREILKS